MWKFLGVPSEDMKYFFPLSIFEAIQMLLETISNQYKAFLIIYFNNFELFLKDSLVWIIIFVWHQMTSSDTNLGKWPPVGQRSRGLIKYKEEL